MKVSTRLGLVGALSILAVPASIGASAKTKPAPEPAPAVKAEVASPAVSAVAVAPLPEIVAVVEGVNITKEELEARLVAALASQHMDPTALPPEQRAQAYQQLLEQLITDRLLTKRAADEKVTPEDVAAAIEKIKSRLGSEDAFKAALEQRGETLEKLQKDIADNLKVQHWLEAQMKGKDEVTEADAKEFFDKNQEQFKRPEQVRASHILLMVPKDAKPEVVAEKEKQAKAISERAKKKGEDFAVMAKELSEDPSAKSNSGDLDYFSKDQMVPEFANKAFTMKKDEISDPVRTDYGFHIIKLTDHRDASTMTFEDSKARLLPYLQQQKKQELAKTIIQGIREKADVKINLPVTEESTPPPAAAPESAPAPTAPTAPKADPAPKKAAK